jgi:DNA-3-methyladenine glycosylase
MKSAGQVKNILDRLRPFETEFFLQGTVDVAKRLIGSYLVHYTTAGTLIGRIVETEAYRQNDPASHSFRGLTRRNRRMFAAGGIAYVYFIYGMYNCFNVVTEPKGSGCAVLIRGMEPVCCSGIMWANRFPGKPVESRPLHSLANGPGKLCRAMGITRDDNGADLSAGPLLVLEKPDDPEPVVSSSARIGITKGKELPWRFFDAESAAVSR